MMAQLQKYVYKIMMVGDAAVGKTTLALRFSGLPFQESYKFTMGVDLIVKSFYVNNKNVVLEIWDCGGQPQFKETRSIYYRKTAGILLCFDLANRKSFEHLSDWLEEITSYGGSPYILLVGTKADLRDKRDVELREIEEFSKKLGVKYIETSSKEGLNINKPFEELAKNLLEKELP